MADRVLVTGSSGFIGSLLESNTKIEYIDLPSRISLTDRKTIEYILNSMYELNCNTLLHLAWTSNSKLDYENNFSNYLWADFTIDLADKLLREDFNFVCLGTCNEYKLNNVSAYVESKRNVAYFLHHQTVSSKWTYIRVFYVVDLVSMRPRLVYAFLNKKDSDIFEIKSGSTKNDFILSEDVLSGINLILEKRIRGDIDLGSGFLTSNSKLIKTICKKNKMEVPMILNDGTPDSKIANLDKLYNFGWRPSYTINFFNLD